MAHFSIDLHTHTTASDGTHTPTQLVQRAARRGLKTLGIADHDTVDGITEAVAAGQQLGVEIVPAIEFSTMHEPHKQFIGTHLLGYFIDITSPVLLNTVNHVRQARIDQKTKQIEILQSLGFDISVEAVFRRVSGVPGRPHIAAALLERNPDKFQSIQQIFDEYLGTGKKAHVKRPSGLTVGEATTVVLEASGVPVVAHPAAYDADINPITLVQNAVKEGVLGVEVYYPYEQGHRPGTGSQWIARMEQVARTLKLLVTGGTDFHGRADNPVDLGDMGLTVSQFATLQAGWQKTHKLRQ
jgi:predicted metal-dependent phosphoesterase TrpH